MDKMFHKLTAAFLSALMLFNGISVRAEDTPAPSSSPEPTVEATASAEPSAELSATPTPSASAEASAVPDAPQLMEVAPENKAKSSSESDPYANTYVMAADEEPLDFSSARLIVTTDDPSVIADMSVVADSYNGNYLMQFDSADTAKEAYAYYREKSVSVQPDTLIVAAEDSDIPVDTPVENTDAGTEMTADSNPISELKTATEEAENTNASADEFQSAFAYDVAIIDTGMTEDKASAVLSVLGDDGLDRNGHGSDMADLIMAQNSEANILSIKALNDDGTGTVASVYAAIELAIQSKARIINLSLSGLAMSDADLISQAVDDADAAGITIVGAAGNYSADAKYYTPGQIDKAIIIGACDDSGARIETSNYGDTIDYNVTAESTSEAAAMFSGHISKLMKNGETWTEHVLKPEGIAYENEKTGEGDASIVNPDGETGLAVQEMPVMEPGDAFNVDIKNLAESSTNASISTIDMQMRAFIRSKTAPSDGTTTIDISAAKDNSIKAWTLPMTNTVYWYSESDTVYMNADSSNMFSGFDGVQEIDLSGISTAIVTTASDMFSDIQWLNKITFGHDFVFPTGTGFETYVPEHAYNGGISAMSWGRSAGTMMGGQITTSDMLVEQSKTLGAIEGSWYVLTKPIFIHFDANGGSGAMDDQICPSSEAWVQLPANKFTRDGYEFTSWNTSSAGDGNSFADGSTISVDELIAGYDATTLYAQWSEKTAKLEAGPKFNQDIKGLTQYSSSYNGFYGGYDDYCIEKMVRSATAPTDGTVTVDVSEAKDSSIVAWFDKDSGTLYWYSSAHKILMNEDCSHMFGLMTSLKSVDMTGWNAQLVTDTSSMFRWDGWLSNIDATIFNSAKNLQIISAMFEHSGIETIDVSGWQTSNLTDASYAFSNTMLTAIDLSAWDTSKISATNGMFRECSSLTTINVADWETGSVIDMSNMFYDCFRLTSLDLSNWDTKNVTDMRSFAGNDSALTTMTFGENFITPSDAAKRQGMFSAPVKTASGKDSDGRWGLGSEAAGTEYAATPLADLGTTAKTMAGTWYARPLKAPKLESGHKFNVALKTLTANDSTSLIRADSENSSIKKFTRSSDAPASGITTADISDKQDKSIVAWFDTDTGTIYWYSTADTVLMNEDSNDMFENMTALESVDVSGLDSTIVRLATNMFWGDKSLKNVDATILNDAVGLYAISGIFENCTNLEKIDVSGWQLGNLNSLASAFQDCSSLKTLDVSKWNLSNAYGLDRVFAGCSSLIELDVSNWDTRNVTAIGSAFSGCSSLVSIDVSKWDTSHVYYAAGVFKGCSRLSAIDFSGWNTKGVDSIYELLSGCTNLRTITFGGGFIAPSGTETGYLRKDMFPTPLLTVSDHDSNGKWGFGSEMASTTYTPDELAEHATTAKAMTGTWYAQMDGVTVTLDPNGGGGTKIVITLPKNKPTPIPDPTGTDPRLPFEGWSTTPDGSSGVTPSGEPITLTEDTTLYAQWGDNPYLPDAGGIGVTSVVALAALSGVLGVLMKRRRK